MPCWSRRDLLAAGVGVPTAAAAGELPKRKLGRSGIEVTALGYGCENGDEGMVRRAAELGITYFVDVPMLMPDPPRVERPNGFPWLGAALRGRRNRVIVSCGTRANTRDAVLATLDRQLRESSLDHFDLWYMLAKQKPEEITPELLEAFSEAKRQGKIRTIGVSTHGFPAMAPMLMRQQTIDVVMVSFNFVAGPPVVDLVKAVAEAGLGIVAMKPMGGGLAYAMQVNPQGYAPLKRPGAFAAALRWVLKHPFVATAPVRTGKLSELEENRRAVTRVFSEADEKLLAG